MRTGVIGNSLLALALVTAVLASGGDHGGATEVNAANGPDPNEVEQQTSPLTLAHVRSADALQAQSQTTDLKAFGATLSTDSTRYTVYLNDNLLDMSEVAVAADTVTLSAPLADGKNDLLLFAPDSTGAPVEAKVTFWAGSSSVAGLVVDHTGKPVAGAIVTASLGDDSTVTAQTTSDASGHYLLKNFPARTVLVSAHGPAGQRGSASSVAGTAFPEIVLIEFGTPVVTPNNEFLAGSSGWLNVGGASLTLVDHVERQHRFPSAGLGEKDPHGATLSIQKWEDQPCPWSSLAFEFLRRTRRVGTACP